MNNNGLNAKYAFIQATYYMVFCMVIGYAAVYLGAIGMSSTIIGLILAGGNVLTSIMQPIIASVIDKQHLSLNKVLIIMLIVMIGLSLGVTFLANVPLLAAIFYVLLAMVLFSLMPLINSLAFAFEEHGVQLNFGVARGIGSVAYAICSLALGEVVKIYSPKLMPFVYIVVLFAMIPVIRSFVLKDVSEKEEEKILEEEIPASTGDVSFFKKYTTFMIFLGGFILVYLDHTMINNFFINVVKGVGGNTSDMGRAVFLAAVLELPAMSLFQKYKEKLRIDSVLKISAIFFTVKHLLTYLAMNMAMIYIAQAFQMIAYALFIPASVFYVDKLVAKQDAIKGQSLVTVSMTISGVFASLLGGVLMDGIGSHGALLVGLIISAVGTLIMLFTTERV